MATAGHLSASDSDLALVLTGGGARAAYQAGLLRHLASWHPELAPGILTGVSAGASLPRVWHRARGALAIRSASSTRRPSSPANRRLAQRNPQGARNTTQIEGALGCVTLHVHLSRRNSARSAFLPKLESKLNDPQFRRVIFRQ